MFLIRVAIDHGWGDVKTVHFRFRAGVLEILTEPAFFDNVIEYNGKYYKVVQATDVLWIYPLYQSTAY